MSKALTETIYKEIQSKIGLVEACNIRTTQEKCLLIQGLRMALHTIADHTIACCSNCGNQTINAQECDDCRGELQQAYEIAAETRGMFGNR